MAQLETRKHKIKSNLSTELKYKLVKSWVRGGSKFFFCNMHGLSYEEYDIVTRDLIEEANHTGEPIQINKSQTISEGMLFLFGLTAIRYNSAAAVQMLGLKRGSTNIYIEEFEMITGEKIEKRLSLKERNYFTKISDELITHSPITGKKMNRLYESMLYDVEIGYLKLKLAKINAVMYCKDSLREFMLYEGDDNNPPGTYEFHFEYLTDVEKKDEAIA